MELLAIIAIVALFIIGGMFIKFTSFKAKLMNEFGRQGIDYIQADILYTNYAEGIHSLSTDGVPISEIVSKVISRSRRELGQKAELNAVYLQGEHLDPHNKGEMIRELVIKRIQIELMIAGKVLIEANNEYAVGYVIGLTDAAMQKFEFDNNTAEGVAILTTVCITLFGDDAGPLLLQKFLREQLSLSDEFREGMISGGQCFLSERNGGANYGLAKHYFLKAKRI